MSEFFTVCFHSRWDSVILMTDEEREAAAARGRAGGAGDPASGQSPCDPALPPDPDDILRNIKEEAISNLVEHPTQLQPPCTYIFYGQTMGCGSILY